MHGSPTAPAGGRPISTVAAPPLSGSPVPTPVPTVVTISAADSIHLSAIRSLERLGCDWAEAADLDAALTLMHEHGIDVCVVCDGPGGELADRARAVWSRLRCATRLVIATPLERRPAPADVMPFPWDEEQFARTIHAATEIARLAAENATLRGRLARRSRGLVESRDAHVLELRTECTRAAEANRDLVLVAPVGTLLENWARLVHETGPRCDAPFVRLDGRTLTTDTFEAELRPGGRIERARGGTIFVDHADQASEAIQARLRHRTPSLRIAGTQEWSEQFVVGWYGPGATNVVAGARVLELPALAERGCDLAELATRYTEGIAVRLGEPPKALDPTALACLEHHHWPGNEVELLGVLENAFITAEGPTIADADVRGWIATPTETFDQLESLPLRTMERRLIEATFERCDGNRERTAKSLGIGIRTLSGKLRDYGYPPRGGPGSNRRALRDAA